MSDFAFTWSIASHFSLPLSVAFMSFSWAREDVEMNLCYGAHSEAMNGTMSTSRRSLTDTDHAKKRVRYAYTYHSNTTEWINVKIFFFFRSLSATFASGTTRTTCRARAWSVRTLPFSSTGDGFHSSTLRTRAALWSQWTLWSCRTVSCRPAEAPPSGAGGLSGAVGLSLLFPLRLMVIPEPAARTTIWLGKALAAGIHLRNCCRWPGSGGLSVYCALNVDEAGDAVDELCPANKERCRWPRRHQQGVPAAAD